MQLIVFKGALFLRLFGKDQCWVVILVEFASLEEDYDDSDIVDGILFSLPGSHGLLDDYIACPFKVILVPEWDHQVQDFIIREEFPDAI